LTEALLDIRCLSVEYQVRAETLRAVDQVDLKVYPDEIVALVGESGCGKSTLAYTIVRQIPHPGRVVGGEIGFAGQDLLGMSATELRQFRWKQVAMVFQAAQNSLNPVMRVADQMIDTARAHGHSSKSEIITRASELLTMVQLEPERVLHNYPYELSGGMKQRVIIALSLLLNPNMLILDEPTTALDVVTQVSLLDILVDIRRDLGLTMLLLTHDMSIVARIADRVAVMYAAQIVEVGSTEDIFYHPLHPYAYGLVHAVPSLIGDLRDKQPIPGTPPDLRTPPPGCRFHPRCAHATAICHAEKPVMEHLDSRRVACHHWKEIQQQRLSRSKSAPRGSRDPQFGELKEGYEK
jgi:peptide/nickel transport system ATP-binding protein